MKLDSEAMIEELIAINEKELFNRLCVSLESDFLDKVIANQPYVDSFSKQCPLVSIGVTIETGDYEPAYIFADGIGMYYTIDGIKETLKELCQ